MEDIKPNTLNNNNEHIYYNITISGENKKSENIRAEFSETRVNPILNKGDDYDLAVVRFDLPTINIPIFIWKPNVFFVSITYLTNVFTREVPFIANQNLTNAPTFFGDAIWHYQDYVDCINLGLLQCFQDFQANPVYLTIPIADRPTEPPKMTYDGISKRCNIYYPLQYDITKPNPIYVYFNALMFDNFPAFQNYGDERDQTLSHYLIVKDNKNNIVVINGKSYFRLTEEWYELFLWNDLQKILFETDSIPVSNEFIAGQKNITRKVLTDFEPISQINDQSNIQFYPQSDLRFYSMFSGLELRKIDMKVFWQSKDGKVYPLYISGNDRLTIKIYFKKKGTLISGLGIF
jgi:hypothetical protein